MIAAPTGGRNSLIMWRFFILKRGREGLRCGVRRGRLGERAEPVDELPIARFEAVDLALLADDDVVELLYGMVLIGDPDFKRFQPFFRGLR